MKYLIFNKNRNFNYNNVDLNVELLRIICCFLVVIVHVNANPLKNSGIFTALPLYINVFASSPVTVFFILSGFFIYDRNIYYDKHKKDKNIKNDFLNIIFSYLHIIKSFIFNILIDVVIILFLHLVFEDFGLGIRSFTECIKNIDTQYIIETVLLILVDKKNISGTVFSHFWYFSLYKYIIILYPITKILSSKFDEKNYKEYFIILFLILFLKLIFDRLDILSFAFEYIYLLILPILFSLFGYLLYKYFIKTNYYNNKIFIINYKNKIYDFNSVKLSILYLIVSFIVAMLQHLINKTFTGVLYSWDTIFTFILAIILIFTISIIDINKFNEKIKFLIYFFGRISLYIYLFHYIILYKIKPFNNIIDNILIERSIIKYIIYFILEFIICLVLSIIFSFIYISIKEIIIMLFYKIKNLFCRAIVR